MTYFEFLLIFIFPILIALGLYFFRSENELKPHVWKGIGLLLIMAMTYTTPWDNYLVKSGVWSYQDDRVLGKIGYVPIEEYLFFILQTGMTGLWTFWMMQRVPVTSQSNKNSLGKYGVGFFLIGLIFAGVAGLFADSTQYLSLITVWALPVILLQWMVGSDHLLSNLKIFFASLVPITLYLWLADGLAIHFKVWEISSRLTTGWKIFSLPVEEALFFLLTNVMVCMGLILFISLRNHFPRVYQQLGLREVKG